MIKTALWQHQTDFLNWFTGREHHENYALLYGGMGVGKTLMTYALMERLGINRMLVATVLPAVNSAWGDDSLEHMDGVNVLTLAKGSIADRQKLMEQACRTSTKPLVVVGNYEAIREMPVDKMGFGMFVCDESQRLKSHSSKTSKTLAAMGLRIPYRLAMTGTPWADRPTDAYGQVRFLNAGVFGKWDDFFNRYAIWRTLPENRHVKIAVGYKNLDDLTYRIKPFTYYIPREKVLAYLPKAQHIIRYVDLKPATRKVYRQMEQDYITWLGNHVATADNDMVQALRLHQITGGYIGTPAVPIDGADEKLVMLMSLLEECGNDPVVVFTRFREDVAKIQRELTRAGITYNLLTGDVHENDVWQSGNGGRVLIANIQAGGAGVKLTRANVTIMYSTGYSATDYEQALARTNRPGMNLELPSLFYHILARGTVDVAIYNQLSTKTTTSGTMNYELEK